MNNSGTTTSSTLSNQPTGDQRVANAADLLWMLKRFVAFAETGNFPTDDAVTSAKALIASAEKQS